MHRKHFLKSLALLPFTAARMKLQALNRLSEGLKSTAKMPVLFLGHGSPMNAIEENEFVKGFRKISTEIKRPAAILCISAHWETKGTYVTAMEKPRTIHDFGGFPQELYEVHYPAPGSPDLAQEVKNLVQKSNIEFDHQWGLDHGAWSVIKHLYPDADIPVIQMSLDRNQPPQYHYELAKELSKLREKGVLVIGSGNMVHNLRRVAWDKLNADNYGFDWAVEASEKMKGFILENNHQALVNYSAQGTAFQLSIPTPEHYLPLIYSLGLKEDRDNSYFFNDKAVGGSLTMTSVMIGA